MLVRHAQAAAGPVDLERPLTDRGSRHAAAIGTWLDRAGLVPDSVLVSPARRALQTWERASGQLPQDLPPVVDARVHDNTVAALLAAVHDTPEEVRTLAVVGHNPSIGELAADLDDGQGEPAARRAVEAGFPTGGVAVFLLGTPFAAVTPGTARLHDFAVPGD